MLTSILLGTRPGHPAGKTGSHNRILAVTSVAMMEGKTTIAATLDSPWPGSVERSC